MLLLAVVKAIVLFKNKHSELKSILLLAVVLLIHEVASSDVRRNCPMNDDYFVVLSKL